MQRLKGLRKLINLLRDSLEDGWIKDIFLWLFWGMGLSIFFTITRLSPKPIFLTFTVFIFVLWGLLGIAVFSKIYVFFSEKININKYWLIIGLVVIFLFIFASLNQFSSFLIEIDSQKFFR